MAGTGFDKNIHLRCRILEKQIDRLTKIQNSDMISTVSRVGVMIQKMEILHGGFGYDFFKSRIQLFP